MTGETTNKPVTALEIYNAYPGSDLLPIDPPLKNETIDAYMKRVGRDEVLSCGDTLFAFILFELADASDRAGCVYMLDRAVDDLLAVKHTLEKKT
jgi:hypothetical protein